MASLQITLRAATGARETYSPAGLSATHHTDALRRLCRLMAAEGMSGAAEVRGEDGRLRLNIPAVEEAARWSLTENDHGPHLRPYQPFDAARVRGQARPLLDMAAAVAAMRMPSPAVTVVKVRP